MTGRRAREVGDFAFDPDIAEHVFEQHPRAAVELADSQDFPVQAESCKGIFNHGAQFKGIRRTISMSQRKSLRRSELAREGVSVDTDLADTPSRASLRLQGVQSGADFKEDLE